MKILDKNPIAVLEHETALKVYLDALLQDISYSAFTAEPQDALAQQVVLAKDNTLEPVTIAPGLPAQLATDECGQAGKVPDWATTSFQGLLFSMNGVKLAVPLIKLHSIVNLTKPITLVPGYASWFVGLLPWRGSHVKVIDIYKLMAMESNEFVGVQKGAPKHVLLVGDGSWGFVCDEVSKILVLYLDQIKWRTDRTRRAWLAGTVIEPMCSLLDVDEFSIPARIMPANCCEDAAFVF